MRRDFVERECNNQPIRHMLDPSLANLIGTSASTTYVDAGVLLRPDIHNFYIVKAVQQAAPSRADVEQHANFSGEIR